MHRVCCVTTWRDETGLMATVACLDARALVDPAPFVGMVLVGLVLKDTASLVILQEVVPEAGLRHCVRFGKLKLIAKCPCSCLDSKKGPMFRLETISLDYTVHGKIGPQLNQYKSSRQSRHWKTHIENVHFDSHSSSCQTQRYAKIMNIGGSMGKKRNHWNL